MSSIDQIPFFNTLDRSVGNLLGKRSKANGSAAELAGALISHALRQGHVCLDTNLLPQTDITQYLDLTNISHLPIELQASGVAGTEIEPAYPLIVSKSGKLYFHRYWHYEQRLIQSIQSRLTSSTNEDTPRNSKFSSQLGADQQAAVQLATRSTLSLISGGPGTGKTTTVLHILGQLIQQGNGGELDIALVAPTGKAAQRVQESIRSGLQNLPLSPEVTDQIPTEASTIHRLLGYQRDSTRFQHNREYPLPQDVVVVDEASMLDLVLFSKLLDALKPQCRLILLGDSHQLASVEAGSIFGDLVVASRTNSKLETHTVELTENFRFGNESALYQACEYIKDGNSRKTIELFRGQLGEIGREELPTPARLASKIEQNLTQYLTALSRCKQPEEALRLMQKLCILTPIRSGPYGVEGLNELMETMVRNATPGLGNQRYFHGLPILITENNYNQQLYNGDPGIILQDQSANTLYAFFLEESSESIRKFPLSALPNFEAAYASTVHKSQGSEYERVFFILPPIDSPILSRELIYTAVSRSRKTVEIWGAEETLSRAIERPTQRTSGILDYLA